MDGMSGIDLMGYQRAYEIWRQEAAEAGYAINQRSIDVLTSAAFATGDNGTDKEKQFFNPGDAAKGDPLLNTSSPSFKEGGNVPSSSIFGIFALGLRVPVQYGTVTQLNTLLAGLGASRLYANIGNQPFAEWESSRLLQSYDAGWIVSNDGAASPLVARSNFQRSGWTPLPGVKMLNPGTQISAKVVYTLPTIPVAFNLVLAMHMFAADYGQP